MTKKSSKRRSKKAAQRKTNWTLIGGVIFVGVLLLGVLFILSIQGDSIVTLEGFCKENPDKCVATGDADAPVTIVEVQDFGCPHCRSFHEETAPLIFSQYVETGQVQFIILPYALGSNTLPATNASMCANEQDSYFEFADALFAQFDTPNYLSRESLISAAEISGLDLDSFSTCVNEGRYNDVITDNIDLARSHRISSTPNFMVNNTKLEGAQPFSVFQQRIESFIN
jgi:protein-disulfide isomerase